MFTGGAKGRAARGRARRAPRHVEKKPAKIPLSDPGGVGCAARGNHGARHPRAGETSGLPHPHTRPRDDAARPGGVSGRRSRGGLPASLAHRTLSGRPQNRARSRGPALQKPGDDPPRTARAPRRAQPRARGHGQCRARARGGLGPAEFHRPPSTRCSASPPRTRKRPRAPSAAASGPACSRASPPISSRYALAATNRVRSNAAPSPIPTTTASSAPARHLCRPAKIT